jgi:hypothetical protein
MDELDARLRTVATGLALIFVGLCLSLLVLSLTVWLEFGLLAQVLAPEAAVVLLAGLRALLLVAFVVNLVGPLLCLATPAQCQGVGFLYASLALQVVGVLASVYENAVSVRLLPPPPPESALVLFLFYAGANLLAFFLFLSYLWALALFVERSDLADEAATVKQWAVLGAVAAVALLLLGWLLCFGLFPLGLLVALLVGLAVTLRYARLLLMVRRAVLDGPPPPGAASLRKDAWPE